MLFRYWEKKICLNCSWVIKTCQDNSRPQIEWEENIEKAPAEEIKLYLGRWYSAGERCAVMQPRLIFADLKDLSIGSRLQFSSHARLAGEGL